MIRSVALCAALALSGCWLTLGLEDKEFTLGGPSGGGGAGASVADGGGGSGGAGGADRLAGMVEVTLPAATFFIDAREVTAADYAAWVATAPSPTGTDPRCDWNTSVVPDVDDMGGTCMGSCVCTGTDGEAYDLEEERLLHPDLPVRCVDYCDAKAYCVAHGKRLCGGVAGATLDEPADLNDPTRSEWYAACSAAGSKTFPYGDAFDPSACNDTEGQSLGMPRDVNASVCEGGYPGIFDMTGNVEEWVDVCYETPDLACFRPGGAFWHGAEDVLDCPSDWPQSTVAREQTPSTGFRCCADP